MDVGQAQVDVKKSVGEFVQQPPESPLAAGTPSVGCSLCGASIPSRLLG